MFDARQQWQGCLPRGIYEIQYQIHLPRFDVQTLFRQQQGRSSGPWDYSHEPHNYGQCLLPEVDLHLDQQKQGRCRTFIPDEQQLARKQFAGRIGFEIDSPRTVQLQLTCTHAEAQWQAIELQRLPVPDLAEPVNVRNTVCFFFPPRRIEALARNWRHDHRCAQFDRAIKLAHTMEVPADFEAAREFTASFREKLEINDSFILLPGLLTALVGLRYAALRQQDDRGLLIQWLDTLASERYWRYFDEEPDYRFQSELIYYFTHLGALSARSWCADDLPEELVERLEQRIAHNTDRIYRFMILGRSTWGGAIHQNHTFFAISTLIFGCLGLGSSHARAGRWARQAAGLLHQLNEHWPDDGSYFEGQCYANFSLHGLLPALWLLEQATDETWAPRRWLHRHWRLTREILPPDGRALPLDDADEEEPMSWWPAALWGANDPHATPEARREAAHVARILGGRSPQPNERPSAIMPIYWQTMIADDEPAKEKPSNDNPDADKPPLAESPASSFHYARDAGLAIAALQPHSKTYFIAGPHMGFQLATRQPHPYSFAHAHPDRGNILLHHRGQWLLADTGYVYQKRSDEHNVLTINGKGQHNDGWVWMQPPITRPFLPPAPLVQDDPDAPSIEIDLAPYYPPDRGLLTWRRQVHFLPARGLVVHDRLALDQPRRPALRFGSACPWQIHAPGNDHHAASVSCPGQKEPALHWIGLASHLAPQTLAVQPLRRYPQEKPWHALLLNTAEPVQAAELLSAFVLDDAPDAPAVDRRALHWAGRSWRLDAL